MAWPAWAGATESTPSASLVNMNGQQSAVSPGAGASTTRLSDRRDRSMGGIGQDLWQETEGGTAQHGPVAGETRSSRPRSRPRRARTTILSERQYHGPGAQAGEGEGWKPQETKLASTEGHRWTA